MHSSTAELLGCICPPCVHPLVDEVAGHSQDGHTSNAANDTTGNGTLVLGLLCGSRGWRRDGVDGPCRGIKMLWVDV